MTGFLLQDVKRLEQLPDAMQRKETGIDGDDRFRAGLQRVEGEDANAGGAIDDDVIVVVPEVDQGLSQDVLPADLPGKRLRDPAQQDVGGSHVEVLANGQD